MLSDKLNLKIYLSLSLIEVSKIDDFNVILLIFLLNKIYSMIFCLGNVISSFLINNQTRSL